MTTKNVGVNAQDLFESFDGVGINAPLMAMCRPKLRLPPYAMDGRRIQWNAAGTACMFESTAEEYHSDRNAVSSTMLKRLDRSAAHLKAYLDRPHQPTASQRFGTAVHAAVLEPHVWRSDYVVYTQGARRGRSWKAFQTANRGKEILTKEEYSAIAGCASQILSTVVVQTDDGQSFTVADLVALGSCEKNLYWIDEATGLVCKARIDLFLEHVTLDLKTTDDAREEPFARQAAQHGYDIQVAFYERGREAFDESLKGRQISILVAAECKAPHATVAHGTDQGAFKDFGAKKVSRLLTQYKDVMVTGTWPAYPSSRAPLKLPLYKRYGQPLNI